jgi:hypothetical protein
MCQDFNKNNVKYTSLSLFLFLFLQSSVYRRTILPHEILPAIILSFQKFHKMSTAS